jgi:hypothetical protein
MSLILIKICCSVLLVLLLVYISELNPRLGGLISGLPTGTGVVIYFYSLERGNDFILSGLPYAMLGLICSLCCSLGFFFGGKIRPQHKGFNFVISIFLTLGFYVGVGFFLKNLPNNIYLNAGYFLLAMFIANAIYQKIPPSNFKPKSSGQKWLKILFRMGMVSAIVLFITHFAKLLGAEWAGIMASFPTVLFPVLLILKYEYQDKVYPTVLRNYALGINTILIFYFTLWFSLAHWGINGAFLLAYALCFGYVWLVYWWQRKAG